MLKPIPVEQGRRLRDYFAETAYTIPGIRQIVPDNELPADSLRNMPRLLDVTRPVSSLHTLVRWFHIGASVHRRVAHHWLPAWLVETCLNAGLLAEDGETLAPQAMLMPFGDALLATDRARHLTSAPTSGVVSSINPTTMTVHNFVMRRPSRATLDIGTGCGPQAIVASKYSGHVVGADLNPRAIEYASFNAQLNNCSNVEFLTGDGFTPFSGRRFDQIIINAPFYISPTNRYMYSDNPDPLDGFCRRLILQAPNFLNEAGYLQMMFAWVEIEGQPWKERLSSWFDGSGCDAWVLRASSRDPVEYAYHLLRDDPCWDPESDRRVLPEWIDYYRAHNVAAIHVGLLTLRRRHGRNWIRFGDTPERMDQPFGHIIERCLDNIDLLGSSSRDELLAARLAVSPGARLERSLIRRNGRWESNTVQLTIPNGLPPNDDLRPEVAQLVMQLDGRRPLEHQISQLTAPDGESQNALFHECLSAVERLLENGFLVNGQPPGA